MSIETWSVLPHLGFEPDPSGWAADRVSIQLGPVKLTACRGVNRYYREAIMFDGILSTPRSIGDISFELPIYLASYGHAVAFISYYLRRYFGEDIATTPQLDWLGVGLELNHLLPWEIAAEESRVETERYAKRPQCRVERPWMKLAIKDLWRVLGSLTEPEMLSLSFDGHVLTMTLGKWVIAMPANGTAWDSIYEISSKEILNLPRRLMSASVEISFYRGKLLIDRSRYDGVEKKRVDGRRSRIDGAIEKGPL